MITHTPFRQYQCQSGAVMAIALVMLLILSLIGISGAQNTSLQERMSGNAADRNVAFQAASSAATYVQDMMTSTATTWTSHTMSPYAWSATGVNGQYNKTSTLLNTDPSINPDISEPTPLYSISFWTNGLVTNPKTVTAYNGGALINPVNSTANIIPNYLVQYIATMAIPGTTPVVSACIYRVISEANGSTPNSIVVIEEFLQIPQGVWPGGC